MDYKNSNTIPMSKKAYTKQDKIRNYRLKYANIRHQYYAMCEKYSSYNKTMLTFIKKCVDHLIKHYTFNTKEYSNDI